MRFGLRRRARNVAYAMLAGIALYLAVAYFLLPSMWSRYERQPGLADRPMVTRTTQGIPGDPINVGLVGSREEVLRAFAAAGWSPADPITLASSVEIGLSVVLDRSYRDAPVSTLIYEGRPQDLAFERPDGVSPDKRHHLRLWRTLETGAEGRPVWLGSASFDRGVGLSHDTGQITHHIDPDLDKERAFDISTLEAARVLTSTYTVTGIGPTLNGRNGEGDRYYTDGDVEIGVINANAEAIDRPPPPPPEPTLFGRLWSAVVGVFRVLGTID